MFITKVEISKVDDIGKPYVLGHLVFSPYEDEVIFEPCVDEHASVLSLDDLLLIYNSGKEIAAEYTTGRDVG